MNNEMFVPVKKPSGLKKLSYSLISSQIPERTKKFSGAQYGILRKKLFATK
jgi:hypothetical protein